MTITGIDHVQVAAPPGCEDEARAFYSGVLGLAEIPKPDSLAGSGGCWFVAGPQELHVGIEHPFAPARKAHPSLVTTDLDALAATLAATGISVAWDERIPGTRRFKAQDPFGNELEFRQA